MTKERLLRGASPYAHFSGIAASMLGLGGRRAEEDDKDDKSSRRSRARADEDEDEKDDKTSKRSRARADDEDEDKGARADEDDDDKEDKTSKRSKARADDEDEDKGARADDGEDEDERETKRSKRSRARADEDDEDDKDDDKDEMTGRSASANARRRERARCAAIFATPSAAENTALACSLAFETSMTRKEAVAVLKSQAGRGGGAHDVRGDRDRDRSARNPDLGPGDHAAPSGHKAIQSSWDAAIQKAAPAARK